LRLKGEEMTDVLTSVMFGLINQLQIWITHSGEDMTSESGQTKKENQKVEVKVRGISSGTVYGLGLIGACVYYISRAATFQQKLRGFVKGLVWPALLVYELLKSLHNE
jgi:hypothetical protein